MKKNFLQSLLTMAAVVMTFAVNAANITVTNSVTSNTTWTSDNIYILYGEILVKNNATLTIEPGTIIKGDANTTSRIVVTTGSKIVAAGTATQPIIFTSNKPAGQRGRGDWAGIIICGLAPVNFHNSGGTSIQGTAECGTPGDYSYGGNDANDSSGVLTYVRIEYAGYICNTNVELNSLTLCGVGGKTKIDHVMVSYGQDDGMELFGGTANVRHYISYGSRDDDFDTDNGWSGTAQYGLIIRVDTIADQGDISNAFESDNDAAGDSLTPNTSGVVSNFTVVGPAETKTSTIDAKYGWIGRLRRNTSISILNSVFIGYKTGLRIENPSTQANATRGDLQFGFNIIAGTVGKPFESPFDSAYLVNPLTYNTIWGGNANDSVRMVSPYGNPANFDFALQAGSPALTGASFISPKLTGFETTAYRGAFNTTSWASGCWTEFTPQNVTYSSPAITQSGLLPAGITLTADNVPGATYNWSTSDTTAAVTVTNTGSYTVTITTTKGCEIVRSSTVAVSGIEEVANLSKISLMPNPNAGMATLSISAVNTAEVAINVSDVTGREIMTINKQVTTGSNQLAINTLSLTNGIYVITLKNGTEVKTVKMVVNK